MILGRLQPPPKKRRAMPLEEVRKARMGGGRASTSPLLHSMGPLLHLLLNRASLGKEGRKG